MRKAIISSVFISAIILFACRHPIPGDNGIDVPIIPINPPPVVLTCATDTAYFVQQILPVFISNCAMPTCHDAITQRDGKNFTTYAGIRAEVRPGDLNNSKIWDKITETDPKDRMPPPPRAPLSAEQQAMIRKWILQGAKNNTCVTSACDSSNVTYSGVVRAIIQSKCQGCHSSAAPAGGYDFTQYAVVKARVNDGKLWGAINHLPGFSPMPKGGTKLSVCEINVIRKWMDAGAPNN